MNLTIVIDEKDLTLLNVRKVHFTEVHRKTGYQKVLMVDDDVVKNYEDEEDYKRDKMFIGMSVNTNKDSVVHL